jgi:hypothetical protein
MAIPSEHARRSIYHFTVLDNLPSILQIGILANNHPEFPKNGHRSVAERGIQLRRAEMEVPCGPGGKVHEYVPLYFGSLSPMLLSVLNSKNVDQMNIVYFEFPIVILDDDNVVFTDASANTADPPSFYHNSSDLSRLNWNEIDSLKWSSASDELRHQRMAEVLVHQELALQTASRVAVWNAHVKEQVQEMVKTAGVVCPPIGFELPNRRHYFTRFMDGKRTESLIKGPRTIAWIYQHACQEIAQKRGHRADAPFATLEALLEALREDFGCLPQTAELIGLRSANSIHYRTVDLHTLDVVAELMSLPEYAKLPSDADRDMVELAAYLHDIGKGPKDRWVNNNGVQKVDPNHPVGAVPMMVDILTDQVGAVTQTDAETILKLVCYHDLVGDVLGKGRDERQIVDISRNRLELDLLFALGKADAISLVEWWWDDQEAGKLYDRCVTAVEART